MAVAFFIFVAVTLVAAGVVARRTWRAAEGRDGWLVCLPPIVLAMLAIFVVSQTLRSPRIAWDAARTTPAVAMTRGYHLYYPQGEGPILNFIYGPVAALVLLPAGLARSPTGAVWIASAICAALSLGPIVWTCWTLAKSRAAAWAAAAMTVGVVCAHPAMSAGALRVHVDAPAIGFAVLAVGMVVLRSHINRKNPSNPRSFFARPLLSALLAAGLAALSVWSKQTMLPLLFALPLIAWMRGTLRDALFLAAGEAVTVSALGGVFIALFGGRALFFNMVTVPGSHPLIAATALASIGLSATTYAANAALVVALYVAGRILAKRRRNPRALRHTTSRDRQGAVDVPMPESRPRQPLLYGRGSWRSLLSIVRDRCREESAAYLLVAIATLPGAIAGFAKVGGDTNNFACSLIFLTLASGVFVAKRWGSETRRASVFHFLPATIGGICALSLFFDPTRWIEASHPRDNPQQLAYEFAKQRPGEVYFPWAPLASLYAEGKLYHFEYGVYDRNLAGRPPSAKQLAKFLPAKMKLIAYQPDRRWTTILELLPAYSKKTTIESLPRWRVMAKKVVQHEGHEGKKKGEAK